MTIKDNRKSSLTDVDRSIIGSQVFSVTQQYYDKWLDVLKSRPEVRAALSRVEGELQQIGLDYIELTQRLPYVAKYNNWLYSTGASPTAMKPTTVNIYEYQFEVQVPSAAPWQLYDTRFLNNDTFVPELAGAIAQHQATLTQVKQELDLVRGTIDNMLHATASIRIINNTLPQLVTMSPHFAKLVAEGPPVKRQRKLKDEGVLKSLDTPEFRATLGKVLISKE